MQPFSVSCETCGARLRVRDESVVGEIHACPKCASMVLIALPAAAPPVAAPTKVSLRADASSELQPHTPSTPQPPPEEFSAEVDHLLHQGAASDTSQDLDSTVAPNGVAAPAAVEMASSGSSLLLWSVVSATGVVVALLGGFVWWSSGGEQPDSPIAAAEPAASVAPEAAILPDSTNSGHPREESTPTTEPETREQTQEVQKPLIEESPAPLPDLPPATVTELKPAEEASPTDQTTSDPSQNMGVPGEGVPPLDADPVIPQLIDPLGINPADLDLLLVPKAPTAQVPPQVPSTELEESNPAAAIPPQDDPLDAPPQPKKFEPGSASLGPSFTEQFAPGAFEARLAMRIPSIRWANAPLNRVLGELGQLSGIPIQIDPHTLRMVPARTTHRITLSQQDASLEAILAQLAENMRLEILRVDNLLILQKSGASLERQISYPIGDLASSEASIRELVQLIDMLALDEPSSASVSADGSQIAINRSAEQQYDVLLFLERLRKSRGLPARSKYPTELVSAEPVLLSLRERLTRPTTFAIVDWTPLSDVFDYWQDSSGLELLVDWRELSTIDLRPLSTIAASADRVPWGVALQDCLVPLDLGWIPVDRESLQITTAAAAANHRWIEFYRAGDLVKLAARQQTADGLREALAERCDAESMAQAILIDDPAGKQILVRANRAVHESILTLADER